jgi:hypothetical protein
VERYVPNGVRVALQHRQVEVDRLPYSVVCVVGRVVSLALSAPHLSYRPGLKVAGGRPP